MDEPASGRNKMTEHLTFDVVILGTGPAGLQAAIHAARKKVSVLVLGKQTKSSLFHAHIENFCCIFNIPGEQILETGRKQAETFGAVFIEDDVMHITYEKPLYQITTESGKQIDTMGLIIATGARRKRLGVPGEKELLGKGVSYCVDCDGNFFRNQDVAVVGEGSAAVDGALSLEGVAGKVYLVSRKLEVADFLLSQLEQSKVTVVENRRVKTVLGDQAVSGLELDDGTVLDVSGVFIELGAKGLMEIASSLAVALDDTMQYIKTDKHQATNLPGVWAAGDICGPPWQMAKAVGEGCVAGIEAAVYAKKLKRKAGQ